MPTDTGECRESGRGAGFAEVVIDEARNATVADARHSRRHSGEVREDKWAARWAAWADKRRASR